MASRPVATLSVMSELPMFHNHSSSNLLQFNGEILVAAVEFEEVPDCLLRLKSSWREVTLCFFLPAQESLCCDQCRAGAL